MYSGILRNTLGRSPKVLQNDTQHGRILAPRALLKLRLVRHMAELAICPAVAAAPSEAIEGTWSASAAQVLWKAITVLEELLLFRNTCYGVAVASILS